MAFFNCTSLSSLVIPSSVTFIGTQVVDKCDELNALYYLGTFDDWNKITIDDQSTLDEVTKNFYSESTPTDTTHSYWHYVDGVPTSW